MRKTWNGYVNGTPLQLALRELQHNLTSPRVLTGMAAAVLVLTISGPFDTLAQFDLPHRLLYWLAIVVLTYLPSHALATLVLTGLRRRIDTPAPRLVIAALASSVPSWLVVMAVNRVASGQTVDPLRLWLYCLAVGAAVVAVVAVMPNTAPQVAQAASMLTPEPVPPAILSRLTLPQRGKLLALSVADHYVDVITDRGTTLLLLRLGDAIRETAPVAGVQIHRSHWVALDAVKSVGRGEGKAWVELENGQRLPVSRGYMAAARAAGLLL